MKACVGVRKKEMCSLTKADLVVVNPRDVILKITSAAHKGLFPTLPHIELKRKVARKAMGSVSRRFVRLFAYVRRIRGE